MNLKNIVMGVFALILSIAVFTVTQTGIDLVTSPKMIYRNEPLPSFNEVQDYNTRKYAPMVRLEMPKGGFFCSGTVISDDYVLTAAHCLMRGNLSPDMYLGVVNIVSIKDDSGSSKTIKAHAAALNNRADYALIKGDFREFTKARIAFHPDTPFRLRGPTYTCGFAWGTPEDTCYPVGGGFSLYFEHLAARGLMYPGMSGGPVIDHSLGSVVAVNTAVAEGFIVVSPLIGLFETLGVELVK